MMMVSEPNQVQGTVKSVASSRQLLRSAPTPSLDAQVWAAFNVNHSCIDDDDKYDNKTISDGGITVDFSIIKVHTSN